MKQVVIIITFFCAIVLAAFANELSYKNKCTGNTLSYIKKESVLFAHTTQALEDAIININPAIPKTVDDAKTALKRSRFQYKKIEFFLRYFLKSATLIYNEANKYEVEEPFMEAREPAGFQVMESLLFSDQLTTEKTDLVQQANLVNTSARDITSLLYNLEIDDKQVLESVRLELIRVITLGITGFDAPELKTGIPEARQVLLALQKNLLPLLVNKSREADSVSFYFNISNKLLAENADFDSFDRLAFLTRAALPLQLHLGIFIKTMGLELNTTSTLNYKAKNLFSKNAFEVKFPSFGNKQLVDLGRQLFFEKGLSQNGNRSCASCHKPGNYFIDGLPKSLSPDGKSVVHRNAPSLMYSIYQYQQSWDGRAKNLEEQIELVLNNPLEMGSNKQLAVRHLKQKKNYRLTFKKQFLKNDSAISVQNIATAITAYLATLSPRNSPFDQYINGNKKALSADQVRGFNLFMGKAQCGTCHYAPLFNGLIPPFYNRTEFEVLGITKDSNFLAPQLDEDSGRYAVFSIPYYLGAFKTPTLRNVARTAPYMHNGAFGTLEKVMDFYNRGGAAGMGLQVPAQTLSSKQLHLNGREIKDIIGFLMSLTDAQP